MDAADSTTSAYRGFKGKVGRTFSESEPWWAPRAEPPKGAPNVIVMLADDMGFSDLGCYGSEIATPNLDALAARGVRYANFHATPLCSPTRAALLTGRNPHAAGMGMIAQINPGFPGYASELPANQPTMAEVMRANGYATMMVGKWHLCRESDLSEAGDQHSWPLQRGFEQYYGFLEALTNFHHPHRLYEGNSVVQTDTYPDGYYLTDDLTDRSIRMVKEVKAANPAKPFFMYFAHGAVHAPLHAKPNDIAKYRGRYDGGWDKLRDERLARQKELGVVSEETVLPPRNSEPGEDVKAWDELSADHRKIFARYMEVYAAMVDNIDQNVGRLIDTLEELGELDNTIFIFTSDNGASREGRESGTTSYLRDSTSTRTDRTTRVTAKDLETIDSIGGPTSWPHYPRGWGMACNTPFRLYKVSAFRGGNQVPMIMSWPERLDGQGGIVRNQYTHVTDLLPTLVDLIGLNPLTARNGLPADPIAGCSFAETLDDESATTGHTEQYLEVVGHRAYYRDGWEIATYRHGQTSFPDDEWQLFDINQDPNQLKNVAAEHPELVRELADAWEAAARENQVFPLEDGSGLSEQIRPPSEAAFATATRITAGTPTLERWRSSQLIAGRSFRFVVDFAYTGIEQGVLVAHGGQEGGYVLFIEDGHLGLVFNDGRLATSMPQVRLSQTTRQVSVNVHLSGDGVWDIEVLVGDDVVGRLEGLQQLSGFMPFTGIDVGIDRRSPVSWNLYQRHGSFAYTGELSAVTYVPGELSDDRRQTLVEQARLVGLSLE